jgi:hypothetical protein
MATSEGTTPLTDKNKLTGSADGDKVTDAGSTTAGAANELGNTPSTQTYNPVKDSQAAYAQAVSSGNTSTGGPSTATKANVKQGPGKRLQNPLSSFSSYTYQISLYMMTPEAYNQFVRTGRKNINILNNATNTKSTVALIQSGGINNAVSARATGFELDMYIDDLKIKSAGTNTTTTATIEQEISFTVYEPYGFSFPSKLRAATLELAKLSKTKNASESTNPLKQHFVLGVRFQGYDKDGKLISSADTFSGDTARPAGKGEGIFERFYDIIISGMKFKLDGKLSAYHITSRGVSQQGVSIKRGRIDNDVTITAGTVGDALDGPNGLFTKINEQQAELLKQKGPNGNPAIEIPNRYKVAFVGDTGLIKSARIVTPADNDKSKIPMTTIKNTTGSNEANAAKSNPDLTQKNIIFARDTSMLQAINNIISQSSYLEDAMKLIYSDNLEPSDDPNNPDAVKPAKNTKLQWYTLSSYIEVLGWDKILNDWAYEITFIIQPYLASSIISPYADSTPAYPGPYKRYEYWYTGKNSEVIQFEQQIDNLFLAVAMAPQSSQASVDAGYSYKAGLPQNEDRTGAKNIEKEAQNSITASLYSVNDWAKSKMTIMGDPDLIMNPSPPSPGAGSDYNQFYAPDGYTISPLGSQNFIEIDFKEGVDYQLSDGLLSINESLTFWQDPTTLKKMVGAGIQGLSFFIDTVESIFSKGKFTQQLGLRRNALNLPKDSTAPARENPTNPADNRESVTQGSDNATSSPQSSNTASDLKTDPPPPISGAAAASNATGNTGVVTPQTQATSPTGGILGGLNERPAGTETNNANSGIPATKAVADEDATTDKGTTIAGSAATGGREETT